MFVNKIAEKDITRQDIAEMEPDLFRVYEKEIDKRLSENKISSENLKWVTINGNHVPMKK